MNKLYLSYIFSLFFIFIGFSQAPPHVKLLSNVNILEHASSIWGYTDPAGIEYALLGTAEGLRIYSLEDPRKPIERYFVKASNSSWRELKTFQDRAYVVTEEKDGMLIVDMSKAPDTFTHRFVKNYIGENGDTVLVERTHTIFIDEDGFIYLAGSAPIGYGCTILDASKDLDQPTFISAIDSIYFHEVHVYENKMYAAELWDGLISVWNVVDKKLPIRITDAPTAEQFTHAAWIEKDRKILYTTDERTKAPVEVWDVNNPSSIRKISEYKLFPREKNKTIPHNVFHHGRYLFVSWYTEGVRILDTKDPRNLIEVGYYDTYLQNDLGFHGCWSVYPYFKSGIFIASDIENGLYVMEFDQNKAAFIEGKVYNKNTNEAVINASISVSVLDHEVFSNSDLNGKFKTGFSEEGQVFINVSKAGYKNYQAVIIIKRDSIFNLDIPLEPLPTHPLFVEVRDNKTNEIITNADIRIFNNDFEYNNLSKATTEATFQNIIEGNYQIACGKWGYLHSIISDYQIDKENSIQILMDRGYQDDFLFDYNWTQITDDTKVKFKKGNFSELKTPFSNYPTKDMNDDIGKECYYTNNYEEIDDPWKLNGTLQLYSPWMNFSGYSEAEISYNAWAYGGGAGRFSKIFVVSPHDTTLVEDVPENFRGEFNPRTNFTYNMSGKSKDSIRLLFHLYNPPQTASTEISMKATLDKFLAKGTQITSIKENQTGSFVIFPNPTNGHLHIENKSNETSEFKLLNLMGINLLEIRIQSNEERKLVLDHLPSGLYIIQNKQTAEVKYFQKIN